MQANHFVIDPDTQALLHEEWRRMVPAARPGAAKAPASDKKRRDTPQPHELSPVVAVLPQLIRLVNECSDRPVNKFRPMIKRLILEQLFMEVGGDAVIDPHHNVQVKHYVELTVRVLARLRRQGLPHDEWSDMPVTPQMFG